MILILEGCDGSGKSTLKSHVQEAYDFVEPIPKSYPAHKTTHIMCGENSGALNMAIYNDQDVILDRGWMSEFIYSKVLRKTVPRFTTTHARMFERMALTAGVTVIVCDPGFNSIQENISVRGDEHIRDLDTLRQVYDEYDHEFRWHTSLNFITYNYRHDDLSTILESIWDKQQGGHTGKTLFGNGYAKTLIVAPATLLGLVPCVSWNIESDAYKLTSMLEEMDILESDLAWTYQAGSGLRNLVVSNSYTRVAYIGTANALSVEAALDGLHIDVRYIPEDGRHLPEHLRDWT